MRILVVEDEKRLANFIKKGLVEQKYSVDVAHDGKNAEYLALTNEYDLIILDIMLPKQNGWDVLENLRNAGLEIPVILLTALSDISNRIRGLDQGVEKLTANPDAKILIEGHTDAQGSEAYNQALSERRARAVYDYFAGKGIAPERMSAVGYGESVPAVSNLTPERRAVNRRVEITVIQ